MLLEGSVVLGGGAVDASGGAAGGAAGIAQAHGGAAGGDGRFVLARNNADAFAVNLVNAGSETYAGYSENNYLISAGLATPFIPDLLRGASISDVVDLPLSFFQSIVNGAPASAVAALYCTHVGPTGVDTDFPRFDYVFLINLRHQSWSGR